LQLKSDVRESLYDEINFWLKSIKAQKTPFMGGDSPDLSDLAVFGVLNAIEGIKVGC
jgi:microsomal prostaglandin-E synthase 2